MVSRIWRGLYCQICGSINYDICLVSFRQLSSRWASLGSDMFHIFQGLLNANIFYPSIAFPFHSVPWRQCFWPKNQTLKSSLVLTSHISSDFFFSLGCVLSTYTEWKLFSLEKMKITLELNNIYFSAICKNSWAQTTNSFCSLVFHDLSSYLMLLDIVSFNSKVI